MFNSADRDWKYRLLCLQLLMSIVLNFGAAGETLLSIQSSFNIYMLLPGWLVNRERIVGEAPRRRMFCNLNHILHMNFDFILLSVWVFLIVLGLDMRTISSLHLCLKTLALYCLSALPNEPREGCLRTIFIYIWIHVIFRRSPKLPQLGRLFSTIGYSVDLFHTRIALSKIFIW